VQKAPKNPESARRWQAFLDHHREAIAAMDFFTVPTITFGVLYCFFVIAHDRRRILHCNVTQHPTGLWIAQQLREAFPYDDKHRYLIHDRDAKIGEVVNEAASAIGLSPTRTSFRSPWQNGIAERWVGSCRRDLLDHVIPLNEKHLKRLLSEYIRYLSRKTGLILAEKGHTNLPSPRQKTADTLQIMSAPRLWWATLPLRSRRLVIINQFSHVFASGRLSNDGDHFPCAADLNATNGLYCKT
jgi:putative transposase